MPLDDAGARLVARWPLSRHRLESLSGLDRLRRGRLRQPLLHRRDPRRSGGRHISC